MFFLISSIVEVVPNMGTGPTLYEGFVYGALLAHPQLGQRWGGQSADKLLVGVLAHTGLTESRGARGGEWEDLRIPAENEDCCVGVESVLLLLGNPGFSPPSSPSYNVVLAGCRRCPG